MDTLKLSGNMKVINLQPRTSLVQAVEVDPGHSFMWKLESYVVIRHEDGNVIVHRTVNNIGQVVADQHRFDENFNPCCYVNKVM